jgi:hypothetical protein
VIVVLAPALADGVVGDGVAVAAAVDLSAGIDPGAPVAVVDGEAELKPAREGEIRSNSPF